MMMPLHTLLPGLSVVDKRELALDTFEEEQKKFSDALERLQLFYKIHSVDQFRMREIKKLLQRSHLCNRYKALSVSVAFRAVKDDISVLVLLLMITSEVEIQKRRMRTSAEVYEFEPLCVIDVPKSYPQTVLQPRTVAEKIFGFFGVNTIPGPLKKMLSNTFTVHSEDTEQFIRQLDDCLASGIKNYPDTHFEFAGKDLILKLNQRLSVDNMIRLINCGYKIQLKN